MCYLCFCSNVLVQKRIFRRTLLYVSAHFVQDILCKYVCTNFLVKLYAMLNKGFVFYKTHTPDCGHYGQNELLYT
jgi:hypothetical protein